MKCYVCGGEMRATVTDLPFKTSQKTIVMLKDLPVPQCERCREYLIEDQVMERVEAIVDMVAPGTELDIVRYAA